jgi:hypothetical protein
MRWLALAFMFPIYLFLALVLPYSFWSLVGLFRSARRRKGFWGWAAMITSVMGLVGLVLGCAALFFVPAGGISAGGIPEDGIATPSSMEGLAEAKLYLGAKDYAKALPLLKTKKPPTPATRLP